VAASISVDGYHCAEILAAGRLSSDSTGFFLQKNMRTKQRITTNAARRDNIK
jgi:hypothetical protein